MVYSKSIICNAASRFEKENGKKTNSKKRRQKNTLTHIVQERKRVRRTPSEKEKKEKKRKTEINREKISYRAHVYYTHCKTKQNTLA